MFFRIGTYTNCDICDGTGLAEDNALWVILGNVIKAHRQRYNITLRQFAIQNDIDPSNLSKMERGIIKPDSRLIKSLLI